MPNPWDNDPIIDAPAFNRPVFREGAPQPAPRHSDDARKSQIDAATAAATQRDVVAQKRAERIAAERPVSGADCRLKSCSASRPGSVSSRRWHRRVGSRRKTRSPTRWQAAFRSAVSSRSRQLFRDRRRRCPAQRGNMRQTSVASSVAARVIRGQAWHFSEVRPVSAAACSRTTTRSACPTI